MKTITIRGRRYRVENVPAWRGECFAPSVKGKAIRIPVTGDTLGDLAVINHEILHAGCWDLDETAVDEIAHAQARAAWACGWRRE